MEKLIYKQIDSKYVERLLLDIKTKRLIVNGIKSPKNFFSLRNRRERRESIKKYKMINKKITTNYYTKY